MLTQPFWLTALILGIVIKPVFAEVEQKYVASSNLYANKHILVVWAPGFNSCIFFLQPLKNYLHTKSSNSEDR